jgi:ribonucleoside-diphosphate reductase alpha chain
MTPAESATDTIEPTTLTVHDFIDTIREETIEKSWRTKPTNRSGKYQKQNGHDKLNGHDTLKTNAIEIDYSRDSLFDELGFRRLKDSYMTETENSPQDRFAFVASEFGSNPAHAQRLYDYASKHWLSFSTPILSYKKIKRGLPISCYLNFMEDTSEGLVETLSETNWLSMLGGGVGIHVRIRSADEKSVGVMPHLKIYDSSCLAYRQGKTRRGSYAAYLDISHPDILQFLEMRKPTGDQNIRTLNLHHGLNMTDDFMHIIERCMLDPEADDTWELKDPHDGRVVQKVSAKELWQRILEIRMQTGEPYLHFIDTANRALPIWLKDQGLTINGSNLCVEIELPTSKDRTAVCCLSSLNLEYYDVWKDDYQFVKDVAEMLDNVLTRFIETAPDAISKARFSAERERSIGVGVLGLHSYFQQKMIPFESAMAKSINMNIFKNIRSKLDVANRALAVERGEAPDAVGYGVRFSHVMAIAPTASTSIILGNTSPSIEPYRANAYRQDTLSGAYLNKNRYLDAILKERCKDEDEYKDIWKSIISHDGSVLHLDCLSQDEKDVFKTAMEIDQRWVIDLAADRAEYLDQGQSVNVFFRPDVNVKYLHSVHFLAWKRGVKALYYCRSDKLRKADKVSQQIERKIIDEIDISKVADGSECLACQ